jgi:hypothetical protein
MRILLFLLPICGFILQAQAERNEADSWVTLDGCRLVDSTLNDGDSFLVEHEDKKYVFRIYWVDAPESTDSYIDRLRDQARYFSIEEAQVTNTGEFPAWGIQSPYPMEGRPIQQ